MSSESRQQKFDRLFILFTGKAFRRNAQPLETSNVPGGLGEHHQQANATDRQYRFVAFLRSVATLALLANDYFSCVSSCVANNYCVYYTVKND